MPQGNRLMPLTLEGSFLSKLLWAEVWEEVKERVKLSLALSYFWGLSSHREMVQEEKHYTSTSDSVSELLLLLSKNFQYFQMKFDNKSGQ